MDAAGLDVDLFIEEVKKYPEIWDTSCKEYHDKIKMRAAWFQVCEKFCEGFADKPDLEKNEIGSKFMKRWKGIKDTFTKREKKQTKSGQGANSARRYIYARQLSFLLKTVDPGPTQTSVDDEVVAGSESLEEMDTTAETSTAENDPFPIVQSEPGTNLDNTPASKHLRIIKNNSLKFMNTPMPNATREVPDDDKSFFESLLPAVKTLPLDTKLEFRCEVIRLLKRFRTMNEHPQYIAPRISQQLQPIDRFQEFNNQSRASFTDSPTQPHLSVSSLQPPYTMTTPSPYSSSNYTITYGEDSMDLFRNDTNQQ